MALLHMLATQKKSHQTLIALTVDHGLRSDSKAEADNVANYCRILNVEHHILHWTGTKPQTGLQNKARNARRQLLIDKCKSLRIPELFFAHQADDQAETFLQRLARGSGPTGLSGMQPVIKQQGIALHRPLLATRRAVLRAYCIENNVPFHDDPSNNDTRFERIRWRQMIQQIEQTQPNFVEGLLRSQKRLQQSAKAIAQLTKTWLAIHQQIVDEKIILPLEHLRAEPVAVIVDILRSLMTTDKLYQVDLERLEDWVTQALDNSTRTPTETALTLGGWWLQLKKDTVVLQRAPPRQN